MKKGIFFFVIFLLFSVSLWSVPDFVGNVLGQSIPDNFHLYWNQVTPENSNNWAAIEGFRDDPNWSFAISQYNFAREQGYIYKFHSLITGYSQVSWVSSLSKIEQRQEIEEWFQDVSTRLQPDLIDVVNEPINAPFPFREALGGRGNTGWDWIITAYELARQSFPNSKLLINEYGIIDGTLIEPYLEIIQLLKQRKLIDGIGLECHDFILKTADPVIIKDNLDILADTGLPIYISELDLAGNDDTQLQKYQKFFPVFYNHPAVKGITLWGYILGQTWRDNTHLIMDSTIGTVERPAMQWLKSEGFLNTETATTLPPNPTPTIQPLSMLRVSPEHLSVIKNTSFSLSVKMDNYYDTVAAFGLDVQYDSDYISLDLDDHPDGVAPGSAGFLSAVNHSVSGTLSISGFDVRGVGPGNDLEFLNIYFKSGSQMGVSDIKILIDIVSDSNEQKITFASQKGIVEIIDKYCNILGDGNDDQVVDIVDALLAAQYYVGLQIVVQNPYCLDVNCDGQINIIDALLIAQNYVDLIENLEC